MGIRELRHIPTALRSTTDHVVGAPRGFLVQSNSRTASPISVPAATVANHSSAFRTPTLGSLLASQPWSMGRPAPRGFRAERRLGPEPGVAHGRRCSTSAGSMRTSPAEDGVLSDSRGQSRPRPLGQARQARREHRRDPALPSGSDATGSTTSNEPHDIRRIARAHRRRPPS